MVDSMELMVFLHTWNYMAPLGMDNDAGRELFSFLSSDQAILCATPGTKRRTFINKLGNIPSPNNGAALTML